jgi:hypothetical protein
MPTNTRISQLTSLGATPNAADLVPITDVDDTSGSPQGTTKKVTVSNLLGSLGTAATKNVGTAATNVVQLADVGGTVKLPAVDGSQLTNLAGGNVSGLGTAATKDVGTAATNVVQLADVGGTVKLPAVDGSQLTSLTAGNVTGLGTAALLNVGTADTNIVQLADVGGTVKLPAVDGSQLTNVAVNVDNQLRGTDNPHIGAFPQQSFKLTDNPANSVMLVTNAVGELEILIPDGGNLFINSPTGGRQAASFGFSVTEDATEPDIEVTSAGENYSVISGDSDSKGSNGLPMRQGFHLPDIGANPAPTLISGGSIA